MIRTRSIGQTLLSTSLLLILSGCVSAPETALKNRTGRCGYDSVKAEEYAFYDFSFENNQGADVTSNWYLKPQSGPGDVAPKLVAGQQLKPNGTPVEKFYTEFQPFLTKSCHKLFLKTGYNTKSLDEEPSIYKLSELESLKSLEGQTITLTEDGAEAHSLSPGTALTVQDISTTVTESKRGRQRLKIMATAPDGETYTIINNRRHFTTAGNSDPRTLAAFNSKQNKTWQLSSNRGGARAAFSARSPARAYKGGGALSLGVRCQKGQAEIFVETDTFISQNQRPFSTEIKVDNNGPITVPMTVSSGSNMVGQAPARHSVIKQLADGHSATVKVYTWEKRALEAELPLLGAEQTITQVVENCQ